MIEVHRATRADSAGLINLARSWPTEQGSMVISIAPDGTIDDTVHARHIDDDAYCILVGSRENRIVGYAAGLLQDPIHRIARLEEVMVTEDHRRTGVGSTMVTAFENWAREKAYRIVSLGGAPAPGFYEKLGYRREHAYHFAKRL